MIGEKVCFILAFLAEMIIVLWYSESLFARKKDLVSIAVQSVLGYLFLYLVSLLDITALNTVSFFLINSVIIKNGYQCALKTAILHSAFLSFIMTIAEVLIALFMSLFVDDFAAYTYNMRVMVIMAILSKLLYLIFALIGVKVFSPHKQLTAEPNMMFLFCSLPIISAIISVMIVYIGLRTKLTSSTEIMMIVTVLALLIVNLIFLMLYNYIQKSNAENLALQLSIQKEEADVEYYQAIQEQLENQRMLIHDIKNHLRTIEGLANQHNATEIVKYISQLESALMPETHSRICTDPVLNLLLYRFIEDCNAKGIEIQLDIRGNCTSFMDAPSITTLYGNLLSNAIEAASVSQGKSIELSVVRNTEHAVVLISMINSCDDEPIPNMLGGFYTIKRGGTHGVGLKSIDRIVQKYNGIATMHYDIAEKKFHHIIQFPISVYPE